MRRKGYLVAVTVLLCAAAALAAGSFSSYTRLTSPSISDLLILTDVSDTTQSGNGTTKSMEIRYFPISDPMQSALDGKVDSVGSCLSGDCPAADLMDDLIALGSWDLSSVSLTFGPWRFLNTDWSPDLVGKFGYDNAVTGLSGGAMVYYSNQIRYLLDFSTLPTDSGQTPIYDASTQKWVPGFNTIYYSQSFDPEGVCYGSWDGLALISADDNKGHDLVIERWRLTFVDGDPTTEADIDLMRATSHPGRSGATVMDVMNTTAGVSSESTPANINGGAAIANGSVIYLLFGTAYVESGHQMLIELWYHYQ